MKYISESSELITIISDIVRNNKESLTQNINNVLDDKSSKNISDLYFGDISLQGVTKETVVDFVDKLLVKISEELKVSPVKVSIISDGYDNSVKYIPRSKRKEWSQIGLLGKLYVYDDGNCVVGERCDCIGGIAVPGNKWQILERSSENTISILYR
jgi:hypothetical protein